VLCRYLPVLEALRTAHIPHAIILGNHDAEGLLTREDIIRFDASRPGSMTQNASSAADVEAGNYWLDVTSEAGDALRLRLWFLDSHNRGCGGVPGWCAPSLSASKISWQCCLR
jgi:hypothetical protein